MGQLGVLVVAIISVADRSKPTPHPDRTSHFRRPLTLLLSGITVIDLGPERTS